MKNSLIDAGPLIALFNKKDKYYKIVLEFIKEFDGILISTWPVITEVSHFLSYNNKIQIDFFTWIYRGGIEIFPIEVENFDRLINLLNKYKDIPMDLADGSLILAAETLNINNVITIDSDYYIYRLKKNKSFNNLLKNRL